MSAKTSSSEGLGVAIASHASSGRVSSAELENGLVEDWCVECICGLMTI